MNFSEVLDDIILLIGIELQSIKPGATIKINDVDVERGCLNLTNMRGQLKSRPIGELEKIWNELVKSPAVHVEGVLHGSGTSRNQPETIFSNLPYIEWLKINNKKHISYVGKNTHAYGTLKRMNPIEEANISEAFGTVKSKNRSQLILVTSQILDSISQIQNNISGSINTIEPGIYSFIGEGTEILFIENDKCELPCGLYPILKVKSNSTLPTITICDEKYHVIRIEELYVLVKA